MKIAPRSGLRERAAFTNHDRLSISRSTILYVETKQCTARPAGAPGDDNSAIRRSARFFHGDVFQGEKAGRGPREFKVGRRTFITFEDAAAWRAERVAASDPLLRKAVKGAPTVRRPSVKQSRKSQLSP